MSDHPLYPVIYDSIVTIEQNKDSFPISVNNSANQEDYSVELWLKID